MDQLPRLEVSQLQIPGTGGEATLILHAVTLRNFAQRLSIVRRQEQEVKFHREDIVLTRAQLIDLIDLLMERVDMIHDNIPGASPT